MSAYFSHFKTQEKKRGQGEFFAKQKVKIESFSVSSSPLSIINGKRNFGAAEALTTAYCLLPTFGAAETLTTDY